MRKTIIGLDLDRESSQISYYSERSMEPETVSIQENQDRYLIPTPSDLFSLIEGSVELGQMTLANFLKGCVGYIGASVKPEDICIMITMKEITLAWAEALRNACQMIGIPGEAVFLQTHRESFCCYTLNQKKELWVHKVALFEYEDTKISSYIMDIDYHTKPALVRAEAGKKVDLGRQGARSDEQWNEQRDAQFLEMIREVFQSNTFSAVYLIGDSFDKTWAVESLQYLFSNRRRRVYQGRNLYTKGACYGAMQRMEVGKKLDGFLYQSEDLVEHNLSMQMELRGKQSTHILINAGVNWFEAEYTCEFILDNTNEIIIYARSMMGGETESYSIMLKGLPERPGRTTRLSMRLKFIAQGRCRVTIRDLGFGEFYPPSGKVWESVLEV